LKGGHFLKNLFALEGETAVVTGASGNLGPVWIEALLEQGASVLAIDRPDLQGSQALEALVSRWLDQRLSFVFSDVRNRETLQAACEECKRRWGLPTVLVNNAGIDQPPKKKGKPRGVEEIPLEENREILEVNTLGAFLVSQVFGTEMVKGKRGSIINIGSLYASVSPDPRFYNHIPQDPPFLKPPAYGASKAALVNLTKYLATLWAPYGVRVNALSPGGVLGAQDEEFKRKFCDRVPMGRMATPEDLKGPLVFLASKASAYVTGIELRVDGGFTAW
jgi:NAD(P)-dependent dehydrogenase (short-subunit alcohol dehydrogenase family)